MPTTDDEWEVAVERSPPPLDIPALMVIEMAKGMEEPSEIASRYGFDGVKWARLSTWKPFLDAVAHQRAEFDSSGFTFRIKAKALTEDVFDDAYRIAKGNDTTFMQKLEFIKLGSKLGDMEPKPTMQAAVAGQGFSVTINLGTHDMSPQDVYKKPEIVDILSEHVQETKQIVHVEEVKMKKKKAKSE